MDIIKSRNEYRNAIGEYITAFAQIELYATMYDAMIKTKNTTKIVLAGSFAVPLTKKLKNINSFIKLVSETNFYERWEKLQTEIIDLNLFRNHIIHGTGFSSFHSEYMRTMIDEEQKLKNLAFKNLSSKDIIALSQRTYHVLTGIDGIQGIFLQDFLKITRSYFSSLIIKNNDYAQI